PSPQPASPTLAHLYGADDPDWVAHAPVPSQQDSGQPVVSTWRNQKNVGWRPDSKKLAIPTFDDVAALWREKIGGVGTQSNPGRHQSDALTAVQRPSQGNEIIQASAKDVTYLPPPRDEKPTNSDDSRSLPPSELIQLPMPAKAVEQTCTHPVILPISLDTVLR